MIAGFFIKFAIMNYFRVYLDGVLIPQGEHSDIDEGTITIRRKDENGGNAISFSESMTFYGNAFETLKAKFITGANAFNEVVKVEITTLEGCCGGRIFYTGKITADTVNWCSTDNGRAVCSIEASTVEYTLESEARQRLKEAIISANHNGFQNAAHPFVRHCIELRPSFKQDFSIIIGILFNFLFLVMTPFVALFNVVKEIIDFLGALFTGQKVDWNNDAWKAFQGFQQRLNGFFIGCSNGHFAPYIRDYASNAALQVGLAQFQSSIFTDVTSPYYNAVWWQAQATKGTIDSDAGAKRDYFRDNAPLDNGAQWLDKVCRVFNAEWWVEGDILRLEPKAEDPFILFDLTTNEYAGRVQRVCITPKETPLPAAGKFSFSQDYSDWASNEAHNWYDDLIDWNTPVQPARKGLKEVVLEVGRARFRQDGLDRDVLQTYADVGLIAAILNLERTAKYMLLPAHIAGSPKILVVEADGGDNFAAVSIGYGGGFYYNYPMWFSAGAPDSVAIDKPFLAGQPNLYTNFWRRDDPKYNAFVFNRRFEITFIYTCENLETLATYRTNSTVKFTDFGTDYTGVINEVSFGKNTITLIGEF